MHCYPSGKPARVGDRLSLYNGTEAVVCALLRPGELPPQVPDCLDTRDWCCPKVCGAGVSDMLLIQHYPHVQIEKISVGLSSDNWILEERWGEQWQQLWYEESEILMRGLDMDLYSDGSVPQVRDIVVSDPDGAAMAVLSVVPSDGRDVLPPLHPGMRLKSLRRCKVQVPGTDNFTIQFPCKVLSLLARADDVIKEAETEEGP